MEAPTSQERLIAAVLAGGEGRRMGGVKALRPFRGAPLVAQAAALARRWTDEVVVVVRETAQVAGAVEAPLAFDRADVPGPLAGLAAALGHARTAGAAYLQTLPVDMPNLPPDLPARLLAALGPGDGCALPVAADHLQPACGLWRVAALAALPAYLATGQSSLRGFAACAGLVTVDFGADAAREFTGANTPEELERLARETP